MASHLLSLEIPQVLNTCILKIFDTSTYSDLVPVTCPTLNITLPGFTYSTQLDFTPDGSVTLTACDLQIQTSNCDETNWDLPDGIYVIKYSVSPNDVVYVEYNHLRISKALNKYKSILCKLDLSDCEPTPKVLDKLQKLHKIKTYLDAAVAKVEECHEPQKGMTLYNYALALMDKLDCTNC
jgi:hypothetical protein